MYSICAIVNNFFFPICILVFQCRYHMSIPLLCTLTKIKDNKTINIFTQIQVVL